MLAVLPFEDEADVDRTGERQRIRSGLRHLHARLREGLARRPGDRGGHGLDQHLQAVLDLDALRRREGQRTGPRERPRGHPCLDGAEIALLRPERAAAPLGGRDAVWRTAAPMPSQQPPGAEQLLLRLHRITWESPGVLALDFMDPDGHELPPFGPGAHIDLHLPDGLVRQYSLCGDPADRRTYRVGVREVEGGRVSQAIHYELRPGALIPIGVPRNNFPLVAIAALPVRRGRDRNHADAADDARGDSCRRAMDAAVLHPPFRGGCRSSTRREGWAGKCRCTPPKPAPGSMSRRGSPSAEPDTILYCCGPERLMDRGRGGDRRLARGECAFRMVCPEERARRTRSRAPSSWPARNPA